MAIKNQARRVLFALNSQEGPFISIARLGAIVGGTYSPSPAPSIRRSVQELRALGYNIVLTGGEAYLKSSPIPTSAAVIAQPLTTESVRETPWAV